MTNNATKLAIYVALTGASISSVQAQVMAQDPLFARTSAVEPNIVFMLDDSGSMLSRHLFQFGGGTGGYGRGGPDNLNQGNGAAWTAFPSTVAGQSPDVNRLYYDPRTLYPRRVTLDASGNPIPMAAGPIGGVTSFPVYFYKPPGTTFYSVSGVAVSNGGTGYPASGVTAKFNAAPKGGVTALATVTTSPSTIVTGVTVLSKGSNYPNTGVTAVFSDPPPGGITAQATVTTVATGKVGSVTVSKVGRDYAPGTGVTFSNPNDPQGVVATGTPVLSTRFHAVPGAIPVTNPGSGYTVGVKTLTFTTAPANGTQATGTAVAATMYRAAGGATVTSTGAGYTSPTVTVNGTLLGGTAATASATMGLRYAVAPGAISVTNPGNSNYTGGSPINLTGTLAPGGVAATATVTTGSMKTFSSIARSTGGSLCGAAGVRPLVFSTSPIYGTVPAAGTATISGGTVTSISISNLGRGYSTSGSPTITVAGCTVQPTFNAPMTTYSGVTSISNTAGQGYTVAPTLPLSNGGTANVASTSSNGIATVSVTPGTGWYSAAPTLTINDATGTGANATPITTTFVGIQSATVTSSGSGYTAAPVASYTGGATFTTPTASSNAITSITMADGGSGYTGATATLTNVGAGAGAVLAPAIVNTGRWISSINMTNFGAGYTSAPTITLGNAGTGSGATFTVNTGPTNVISAINVTRAGSGYFSAPTLTLTTTGGTGATFVVSTTGTPGPSTTRVWDGNPINPNPNTTAQYFTPSYLPDGGSQLFAGADATLVYPNLADVNTNFYPKFLNRSDCTTIADRCTWSEEQQNYANWLLYHSTRVELAKTGIGLAFQPLNPTFRLGWGTINDMDNNSRLIAGVQLFNTTTKTAFLNWLYGAGINGGTPNRRAIDRVGQYYQRSDDDGPWATSPPVGPKGIAATGTDVTTHASCRRAYSLLMTDGYYNENFALNDVDTTIGVSITSPSPYQYTPIGPYSDKADGTAWSNTFADVAMKYWSTDLRPTLPNKVKPSSNDPAYWQHMNFYAIGLGVEGNMDATSATLLQDLSGNATSVPPRVLDWPQPVGNGPGSIDDMWHATINGRGKIFNAKTTSELTGAIGQMLSDVAGAEGSQAGVAVSTASLNSDTKKYTPRYTPITWTGNLTAYNLDATTAAQSTIAWEVETLVSTDVQTGVRTYSSTMPSAVNRNIFAGNGASSGTRAVPFTLAGMGSLTSQMTGTVTSNLIDYLRGDTTNEDTATTTTGMYRFRQTRLGDIVNSTPVFIKNTLDMKYDTLPLSTLGQGSYRAYVDGTGTTPTGGKKQRTEGILAVGANDGMLHLFRDGTKDSGGNVVNAGGVETFAYVPNALLPTIHKLADKAYAHQYYVDGPLIETDAFLTNAGRWGNLILGSTGGGAGAPGTNGVSPRTGVFAIDVTSLNSGPTTFNGSSVLWEVSSTMTGFEELGYVLTELEAGTTIDGQWVAIFGNGYESKSCKAQLFIVNLETGALIKRIDTGAGSGNCADKNNASRNGLGGVRVVRNANQQIIGVYAGDLLGNLWKFNLNNTAPSSWNVDLANTPLFTAGSGKPITAAPSVIPLTLSSKPAGGYMVVMGTGKFFEVDDIVTTNQQSLYGIWDPVPFGTAVATTALTDTSRLIQQTIGAAQNGVDGNTYFNISANAVDYTSATPNRGWFIDVPNSGQRMIYPFELLKGQFILADTISPANVSLDVCAQNSSGTGYLYLLDALTGAGPTIQVFDTNGDGNVDGNDLIVSGVQGSADGKNKTIAGDQTTSESKFFNCSADSPTCRRVTLNCSLTNSCPVSNPGAATIDSRMWQQLFMR